MNRKKIYKCYQNALKDKIEICVTDENGHFISSALFDNFDETVAYFHEIKNELAKNEQLEIVEIDDFQFECQSVFDASASNGF